MRIISETRSQERVVMVKKMNLGFNCLSKSHLIKDCRSGLCRQYQQRHHTLLHTSKTNDDITKSSPSGSQAHFTSSETSPSTPVHSCCLCFELVWYTNLRQSTIRFRFPSQFYHRKICTKHSC
jgi:hypothetical protein